MQLSPCVLSLAALAAVAGPILAQDIQKVLPQTPPSNAPASPLSQPVPEKAPGGDEVPVR